MRRPTAALLVLLPIAGATLLAGLADGQASRAIRVMFAERAGDARKVDGLSASRRARPGHLLALDAQGKLPRNALPVIGPSQLGQVPAARLESSGQSVPDNALTTIDFARVDFATPGVVQGDELRAPIAGVYSVTTGIRWPPDPDGIRALFITTTGAGGAVKAAAEHSPAPESNRSTIQNVSTLLRLEVGQGVVAQGVQDSGGPLVIPDDVRSFLAMHWVSR